MFPHAYLCDRITFLMYIQILNSSQLRQRIQLIQTMYVISRKFISLKKPDAMLYMYKDCWIILVSSHGESGCHMACLEHDYHWHLSQLCWYIHIYQPVIQMLKWRCKQQLTYLSWRKLAADFVECFGHNISKLYKFEHDSGDSPSSLYTPVPVKTVYRSRSITCQCVTVQLC